MTWNATNRRQLIVVVTAFALAVSASPSSSTVRAENGHGLTLLEPNHSVRSIHIDDESISSSEMIEPHDSYYMNDHSDGSGDMSMGGAHEMEGVSVQCACGKCKGVCKDPGHPAKPRRTMPGDRNKGDCPPMRYQMSDCERSGSPHCYHRWAKCSVTSKYSIGVVGGGAAFWRGRPRTTQEGTWGMDYDGLFGHVNNWLDYTRCRNQGGEGAYETVGGPEPFSFLHHE